jgi:hypothetical protein
VRRAFTEIPQVSGLHHRYDRGGVAPIPKGPVVSVLLRQLPDGLGLFGRVDAAGDAPR